MKYAVALCLALVIRAAWAQNTLVNLGSVAPAKAPPVPGRVYAYVEQLPNYPNGGLSGVLRYFAQNVNLPEEVKSGRVQGRVFVNFVVDETGKVKNATIMRGLSPAIDLEALRVVRSMPLWTPGSQNGVRVAVSMTVPVMFSLNPPKIPTDINDLSSVCQ